MAALVNIVGSPYLSFLSQYVSHTVDSDASFWQENPSEQFGVSLLSPVIVNYDHSAIEAVSQESSDTDNNGHTRFLPGDPPTPATKTDLWLLVRIVIAELLQGKKIRNPVDLTEQVFYVVFTPPGVTNDGGTGGYHQWNSLTLGSSQFANQRPTVDVPWAVVGAIRYPVPFPKANAPTTMDDYTEVFSHELAEAVSDPRGDGVRLLPNVLAFLKASYPLLSGQQNEVGDVAQYLDPNPFRRIGTGESLSAYWSDWHGAGIVPERYPYPNEFSAGRPCPPVSSVRQYATEIAQYLDTHGGDPALLLNGLRRHDAAAARAAGLRISDRAAWEAVAQAAQQIAESRGASGIGRS
ncbi:hypothetical protein [Mycobacterium sp.]|uniref:hypothetical protein n=1 Tax=Mycobacterium sp. TaxID=1785 RepID=UPI003F96BDA9